MVVYCFFFQAEDGIRDYKVTGVQTCALPILSRRCRRQGHGDVLRSRELDLRRVRLLARRRVRIRRIGRLRPRSEERRVGKEWRSRWSAEHYREQTEEVEGSATNLRAVNRRPR